jgi:hypothetical protein
VQKRYLIGDNINLNIINTNKFKNKLYKHKFFKKAVKRTAYQNALCVCLKRGTKEYETQDY